MKNSIGSNQKTPSASPSFHGSSQDFRPRKFTGTRRGFALVEPLLAALIFAALTAGTLPRSASLIGYSLHITTHARHMAKVPPASSVDTPIGSIVAHAGIFNDSPSQTWRPCLGQSVRRADYHALFLIIGTAWGDGDQPGTTFNLPNLQGMFLRGVARGSSADPERDSRSSSLPGIQVRSGGNSGDAVGSLQAGSTALPHVAFSTGDESNRHSHGATATGQSAQGGDNTFGDGHERGVNGTVQVTVQQNTTGHTHTVTTGGDKETRPVNAAVNYLIRVK